MAFSDASVEVEADFGAFERTFPARLKAAVSRATPILVAEFRKAGAQAGDAFTDAIADALDRLPAEGRRQGALTGRAFAAAAETFTRSIGVDFDVDNDGAAAGLAFRQAAERFTQRIPVTFAARPSARTVGIITGRRFRAGVLEGMGLLPVEFDLDSAVRDGRRAGSLFRAAAASATRNIPSNFRLPGSGTGNNSSTGLFSRLTGLFSGLSTRMKLIITLAPLLTSALAGATVQVGAFIGSLFPLVGLLAIIPSALFVLAGQIGIIAAASERLGKILKNTLVPAFKGLRDQIGALATAGLEPILRRIGEVLRVPVRLGAAQAAAALNELLRATALFFTQARTGEAVSRVFASVAISFQQMARTAPLLLAGLRDLTVAILPAFDDILRSINRVIAGFSVFLSESAASGRAFAWVENAITALKDLGTLLFSLGSIVVSVFQAAAAVGGNALDSFANASERLANFLNTAEGFQQLVEIFTALQTIGGPFVAIARALAPAFAPLADIASVLNAALSPLVTTIADIITALIQGLAPAFESLRPLLVGLSTGIIAVLEPLAPLLLQVGSALATALLPLSQVLGNLLAQLGPPLGELVTALGQLLLPILTALTPITTEVVNALTDALPSIVALIPPVTQLVIAMLPLADVFSQWAVAIVQTLAPLLRFAAELGTFVNLRVIVPLFTQFADAVTTVVAPLRALITPLREFGSFASRLDVAAVLEAIGRAFFDLIQTIGDFIGEVITFFRGLPARIGAALAALPGLLFSIFEDAVSATFEAIGFGIGTIFNLFASVPTLIGQALAGLAAVPDFFARLWATIVSAARTAFNNVVEFVAGLPARLANALAALPRVLSDLFTSVFDNIRAIVSGAVADIVGFIRSIPDRIAAFGATFFNIGSILINKLLDGLTTLGTRAGTFVIELGNKIKAFINNNVIGALERGLNRALPFNISIPRLAQGAFLKQATLALVAEAGPEVVIPLNNPSRARQLADESGLTNIINPSTTPTVNVTVMIGQQQLNDIVQTQTNIAVNRQGDALLAGPRSLGD